MRNRIIFAGKSVPNALRLSWDGIWYATKVEEVSYPSAGNDRCFEIEDESFWFQHRNACIIELVKKYPPCCKGPIFDVGGGNGFVAKGLLDAGYDVVVVEPGRSGALNAKRRGLKHVVCATLQTAQFRPCSMPAIGVFDVIEHIEDDVKFLRYLCELLEPGGMLYLTVPTYKFLWSQADDFAGHYRRYTKKGLIRKLHSANFEVCFATYFFCFLPFLIFLFRTLPFRLGQKSAKANSEKSNRVHKNTNEYLKKAIWCLLVWEKSFIKRGFVMAIGGSCLVSARKNP